MAWAQVTVGDAVKASDVNNIMAALENQFAVTGYFKSQAPAAANSAGTAGTITYDANYIYCCVAANTWKRVAVATW